MLARPHHSAPEGDGTGRERPVRPGRAVRAGRAGRADSGRAHAAPEERPRQTWLLTYSDLVTLLLAFFVLLLSMSSMNRVSLSRISAHFDVQHEGGGQGVAVVPERIRLLEPLLAAPAQVYAREREIRSLLFPDADLPPDVDRNTLDSSVRILEHPEGVVVALADDLLFAPGEWTLRERARPLLTALAEVLGWMTADVAIAGHSDPRSEGGAGQGAATDGYQLAGRRGLTVLEYFVQQKMDPARFSVAGYGPDRPAAPETGSARSDAAVRAGSGSAAQGAEAAAPDEGERNRRVEILVKTTPKLGGYL